MKNNIRGFTLIELLVVISIISLLSSVILASLSSARTKAVVGAGLLFDDHVYHAHGASLVGMYNFDENTGTTLTDSSGNNKNGTIIGSATWVPGINGSALSFDGTSAYVDISLPGTSAANGYDFSAKGTISVSTWVYSTNFGNRDESIIWQDQVNSSWGIFFQSGLLKWSSQGTYLTCNNLPANNAWHNITATQTATNATIYVDGHQCSTGSVTYPLPVNFRGDVSIGAYSLDPIPSFGREGYYFLGSIDQVRIYSDYLLASDVQKLYAEGLKKYQVATR